MSSSLMFDEFDGTIVKEDMGGWFVWTKNGHRPTYAHETYAGAAKEARRLAHLNPGTKFIVLQMVDKWHEPVGPDETVADAEELVTC